MFRLRRVLVAAVASAVVATGFTALGPAPEAEAVPDTIPLTITNDSGRDEPVYLYNLGTELSSGRLGYADADGTFHAWTGGGSPPVPAPDASIPGPANGETITIQMPKFSGRVYFAVGEKLHFALSEDGLVQPAVQNPDDPNRNIRFNWSEYTLNDDGLWMNSTQVDMFTAPYSVGVRESGGAVRTTGELKSGGYQAVFDGVREAGWGDLVHEGPDGEPLRVLSPGHGVGTGDVPADVLGDYIDRVWDHYASQTLTVTPFSHEPDTKYYGNVEGGVMNFRDGSGEVVTSFEKPDSDSVFGCYKLLDAPNDLVRGPLSRTLCAAFNRTTLLTNSEQPDQDNSGFYQDSVTNHYARVVHEAMVDGKAYAFAFDDVGAHESLVHDGDPTEAFMTFLPYD
ncbi:glycoside hydrolase family 64 protein [Streptomyces profundus]|uniref:glycoside hydrolase family 64 protein n=1 Tax=Streptomyces profundus TaxID=2867410 RepID=UPI001D16C2A8|nr:glycoside hydrolase family 64 protein [Streptomyces sp. MA3_2.13]